MHVEPDPVRILGESGSRRPGLAQSKWFVTPDTLVHEFAHALTVTPLAPYDPKETHKADEVLPQTWTVAEHVADAFAVIYNHEQTPDAPLAVVANFDGGRPLGFPRTLTRGSAGSRAGLGRPTRGRRPPGTRSSGRTTPAPIGTRASATTRSRSPCKEEVLQWC